MDRSIQPRPGPGLTPEMTKKLNDLCDKFRADGQIQNDEDYEEKVVAALDGPFTIFVKKA